MASHNEYPGYVKLPKEKSSYKYSVRLDFNGHINAQLDGTRLEGFTLRVFATRKNSKDDPIEIGLTLRPEEWLDLVDSMKEEFESVSKARKDFDQLR